MQKIKYTFADGTTSEIEVSDEIYALHLQLLQEEKRNHWRETRRHTSLNYLMEMGVDFADTAADPFAAAVLREDDEQLKKAISKLLPEQQELLRKVYFEYIPQTEIATKQGVTKKAINNRLARILQRLQKFLD